MDWRRSILLCIENESLKNQVIEILNKYQLTFTNTFSDKHFDLVIYQGSISRISKLISNSYAKKFLLIPNIEINRMNDSIFRLFDEVILLDELQVLLKYKVEKMFYENINSPIIQQKGLFLHKLHKYIKYKNNVVFLSNTEFLLMEYLVITNNYLSTENIVNYLKNNKEKEYNKACATVLINRLSRKIFKGFGLKIIKSRYGMGYYLSI